MEVQKRFTSLEFNFTFDEDPDHRLCIFREKQLLR